MKSKKIPTVAPLVKVPLIEVFRQSVHYVVATPIEHLIHEDINTFFGYCAFNYSVEGLESLCETVARAAVKLAPVMQHPGCWPESVTCFLLGQLGTVELKKLVAKMGKEWQIDICPFSEPDSLQFVIGTESGLQERERTIRLSRVHVLLPQFTEMEGSGGTILVPASPKVH